MKQRNFGKPVITVHTLSGTSEQIAQNRERFRQVCEKIMSRIAGQPMCVEINWQRKGP